MFIGKVDILGLVIGECFFQISIIFSQVLAVHFKFSFEILNVNRFLLESLYFKSL